jgi:hypothetical protein
MIFGIIIGVGIVMAMSNIFATADKEKDGSRGWNHRTII